MPMDRPRRGVMKMLAAGIVTGAADDDPSAIGTYASAGARYGLAFLWIAPVLLPMMYVVVYLSAKIGQVYDKGLLARSEEHTSELQSLMRISSAVFCLKKKTYKTIYQ